MKLTVKQAAVRAGVCASVVYGWCAAKRFPLYRLGNQGKRGKIVIDVADLDTFLSACRVEPEQAKAAPAPHPTKPKSSFRHLNLR